MLKPNSLKIEYESPLDADTFREIGIALTEEVRSWGNCKLDIAYSDNERQKLDLYFPDASLSSPVPVFLYMHGGRWTRGTKDSVGYLAPAVTSAPAILVGVGFRLATEVKYPGPVDDCRAALKWVYENISEYGGDLNRIFVGGHSSGGHLSSLITLQKPALKEIGLPDNVIKGCFPLSGVYDVSTPDRIETFLNSPEDVEAASPLLQVAGNDVPFFVTVGENDSPEHRGNFRAMVDALKEQSGQVESADFPGLNHFENPLTSGEIDSVWAAKLREWMNNPPKA